MQDLNQMPVTNEEDEAMQDLTNKQQEQLQQHEQNHAIIQGATGAQYTPIDTKQFEGQAGMGNNELMQMILQLNQTMQTILLHIAHTAQQPVSEGLNQACSTVLENAEWFNKMVNDSVVDAVEDHDFSDDIETAVGSEVEQYFNYNFNLEDHCDVYDLMRDAVDDKLEDMVQEKLEEILNERLSTATITFK
jgi:hypothetical protein